MRLTIWRPKDEGARRLPLIIFTRGGNRDFGRIPPMSRRHRSPTGNA